VRRLTALAFSAIVLILIGTPAHAGDTMDEAAAARNDALQLYSARLLQVGRKVGSYPQEAVARKLEGTAQVMVTIAADGSLKQHELVRSSGHGTLDAQALAMVEKAVPLAEIPSALKSRQFDVLVTFVFALPRANRA
jgi:protein TonB